jgi:hypothetical protein
MMGFPGLGNESLGPGWRRGQVVELEVLGVDAGLGADSAGFDSVDGLDSLEDLESPDLESPDLDSLGGLESPDLSPDALLGA